MKKDLSLASPCQNPPRMLHLLPPLCVGGEPSSTKTTVCEGWRKPPVCTKRELDPIKKIISTSYFQLSSHLYDIMESQTALSSSFSRSTETVQSSGREALQSACNMGLCRRWHLPVPTQHISRAFCCQLKEECSSFSLQLLEIWRFFLAMSPQLQVLWVSKLPGKLWAFTKVIKRRSSLIC